MEQIPGTPETENYWQNFSILKETVSKIQSMTEPDVDQLIPLVEQATKARTACLDRINAVGKLLGIEQQEE